MKAYLILKTFNPSYACVFINSLMCFTNTGCSYLFHSTYYYTVQIRGSFSGFSPYLSGKTQTILLVLVPVHWRNPPMRHTYRHPQLTTNHHSAFPAFLATPSSNSKQSEDGMEHGAMEGGGEWRSCCCCCGVFLTISSWSSVQAAL